MAKVVLSPAVHSFTDLRPASRGVAFTPRPNSRLSTGFSRPKSGGLSRTEKVAFETPRTDRSRSSVDIPLPNTGRRSTSIISFSSGSSRSADPKLSAIEVESILREKIRVNFAEMRQAFQTLDVEKNLSVTASEFRRVIESFCFPMTQEQFSYIIKKTKVNRDGSINYLEFLEKLHQRGGTPDGLKWLGNLHKFNQTKSPPKEQGYGDIEQQLKTKIGGQYQAVLKAIRLFDYNRDGQIQRHELRRVIENFCFKLSNDQFDRLWCKYDMTRNGHTLDYMDFLKRLGVDMQHKTRPRTANKGRESTNENRPKFLATNKRPLSGSSSRDGSPAIITVNDLERKLRTKMVENVENIKRAFVAFDRRGDGFVTLDELKRVLTHFVFPMSDNLFEELMRRCGVRANHKIGYEQFLEKFQDPRSSGNGQTIPIKPSHKYNPVREAEDMPTTEDIWKFLFSKVTDSFTTIKQAFLVFDDNKDGRITRRDFRRILESFCFRMTEEQFHELMAKIDPTNKGYISYLEFLDRFEHREGLEAHPWLIGDNSNKSISPPAVVAWSTVEDILRSKIMDNWKSIATAYVNADSNRDGTISRDELRRLLEKFCLPLSDDHFEMLWGQCDMNSDGHVDFQEFLNNLGVDIVSGDFNGLSTRIHDESEAKADYMRNDQFYRHMAAYDRAQDLTGRKTANSVMDILKEHISQRSPDIRKTFVRFDGDGDGKLSRKEFREVLDSLGLYMTDEQYRILSARLGFHKGKLTYRDFLDNFEDRRSVNIGERAQEYPSQKHNQPTPLDHAMTAEEVEAKLRGKLRDGFLDLRTAFMKIDFDKNGLVTRAEFRRILDSLLLFMSDEEFDKLMARLHLKKGDRLSYKDFLKRFEHVEKIEEGHPWLYSNHTFNETKDLQYLSAERADQIIKRKAIEQTEDLTRAFLTFDRDGNGIVTKKELRKVLHRFQVPVNKEEFKKLWNMYDTDGNGYVDHQEFIAKLGGEFVPGDTHGISTQITHGSNQEMQRFHEAQEYIHENATVNQAHAVSFLSALDVEQRLRDRFRDGYESLRKAFESVDVNRDGYITRAELQKILFDFHYFLDEQQFNILLDRCGLSGRNKLSYERFLSAFQDNRHAGYGRVTLDTPEKKRASPVVFESYESLAPERAIEKLRGKISSNYDTIKKAFSAFDGSGSGLITKEDLHQIINAFCFYMTDKQFQVLLKQLGVGKDGLVSYDDFLDSFQKSDSEASQKWLERLLPQSQRRHRSPEHRHPAMSEEDVKRRVKEVVMARFYSFAKAFTDADSSRTGTVSHSALKRVLDEHVFRMNEQQFDYIWASLPKAPDGHVEYREFLKMYSARNDVVRSQSTTPPRTQEGKSSRESMLSPMMSPFKSPSPEFVTPPLNATEVERKIKNQVCKNWQQIHKSFRNVDPDNTGQVTFQQLKDVLGKHQISLGHSELLSLWKKHNTNGKGRIVYKEFLKHFVLTKSPLDDSKLGRPKLQPTKVPSSPGVRSDVLMDVMATIRAKVRQDWKEMRRSFRAIDKDGSGTCSPVEFRQMLRRFKIELNEEEFFHVYSFYDKNMIGKISYNEFLKAHLE